MYISIHVYLYICIHIYYLRASPPAAGPPTAKSKQLQGQQAIADRLTVNKLTAKSKQLKADIKLANC